MKRLLLTFLAACLSLSLLACSSVSTPEEASAPEESQVVSQEEPTESAKEEPPVESEAEQDPVEKADGEVRITIPRSLLLEGDSAELSQEEIESGFVSCVMNEDGSLTYTIDEASFDTYLADQKAAIEQQIAAMQEGDTCPSVVEVTANSDWTDFEVSVDEEAFYQSSDRDAISTLAVNAARYQLFSGTPLSSLSVTVYIQNSETNEVLDVIWFPNENDDQTETVG